ncbi:MAG: ligase-associated DNA damage response endonuclease PdeM [Amphiplicatus sp.]
MKFEVSGVSLIPTPEGALWWPEEKTLVVADLHFEKGSSFAARGVLIPPYDTRSTLRRLAALTTRLRPARVISLGDAFHDRGAETRMDEADAARLAALIAGVEWIWALGNHDPAPPTRFKGEVVAAKRLGPLIFRHEPTAGASPGEIAGHLHPCARVRTESRVQRRRCFATDGARLVLPAFGAYAGGLNVLDEAFANILPTPTVWALGRREVYAIAARRLIAEPARRIA